MKTCRGLALQVELGHRLIFPVHRIERPPPRNEFRSTASWIAFSKGLFIIRWPARGICQRRFPVFGTLIQFLLARHSSVQMLIPRRQLVQFFRRFYWSQENSIPLVGILGFFPYMPLSSSTRSIKLSCKRLLVLLLQSSGQINYLNSVTGKI